jgi:hypothetical protein
MLLSNNALKMDHETDFQLQSKGGDDSITNQYQVLLLDVIQ